MKYTISRWLLFFSLLPQANLSAVSMVYNFRIAAITKQPITESSENKNSTTIVALLFDQYRKKYNDVKQNFVGGLGSFIYDFQPYYFRTDFAVSRIKEKNSNQVTTFSGTETDDILFTVGRNFVINHVPITLSGLFGVPTHRIYRLQHIDFGSSQFGTGIQLDGQYGLNQVSFILYGARYVYFIPRKAWDNFGIKHIFTLGNVADLLFACKNSWAKHGLEFGYTARFRFGAHIHPNLDDTVKKTNYIRSNFYIVYKYKFSVNNIPNRLLFYLAYGFDHTPKVYGNRYIVTLWTSWNISF